MKRLRLRRFSRVPPVEPVPVPDPVRQAVDIISPSKPAKPKPVVRPSRDPHNRELTSRQGLFLRNYLIDGNGTKAAIAAGCPAGSAHVQASKWLKNPKIAAEIRRRQIAVVEKLDITPQRIAEELGRMGFANMQDFMSVGPNGSPVTDFSKLTREQASALQEITVEEFTDGRSDKREVRRVKFKLADKANALMLLGKNLGMFVEKHEHDHQHTLVSDIMDEVDQVSRANKARLVGQSTVARGNDDGKAA